MFKKRLDKYLLLLFILTGVISIITAVIKLPYFFQQFDADKIQKKCQNDFDWRNCYGKELAQLTTFHQLSYVRNILDLIQKQDTKTWDCHVIAHRMISMEMKKNPAGWKELLKTLPLLECNYGYIHGVVEGRSLYDPEFVLNEKTIIQMCEDFSKNRKNVYIENSCMHIMGHVLLVSENAQIDPAIGICSKLSQVYRFDCYTGVFMERVTKDNLVIHGLAAYSPWDEKAAQEQESICNAYSGDSARACWFVSALIYNKIGNYNPKNLFQLCGRAENISFQDACYGEGVATLAQKQNSNDAYLFSLCSEYKNLDVSRYSQCITVVVRSLMQASTKYAERAERFCSVQTDQGLKKYCERFLKKEIKMVIGS